jgi:hypothetical protein
MIPRVEICSAVEELVHHFITLELMMSQNPVEYSESLSIDEDH